MRPDIEELVRAAKQDCNFRSVLLVTNGVLLDKRTSIYEHLNGLIVSLDAITHDPSEPQSKSAQIPRVLKDLAEARRLLPPGSITISCVLDLWNVAEARKILDYCRDNGFQFSVQSSQNNGKHPNFAFLQNAEYQSFVDDLIEMRRQRKAMINGTPKLLETLLRFEEFKCYPTMFPRIYPNGDIFYPCEVLRKIAGNVLEDGSISASFERGRQLYGETPECKNNCFLFGNVLSSYYVEDFWGLAGDTIRRT